MNKLSASVPTNPAVGNSERIERAKPIWYVRYFFVGMGILFFIISIIGFTPSYQGVADGSLKLHWFAHVHGAIMTSWLVLFLAQALLAASGKLSFHRQLGQLGFGLGILVWLVLMAASARARLSLYIPLESELWDILLVELAGMSLFGLFFSWGMIVRKKASDHKRLLLLATLVLMGAGIDRTGWLPGLYSAIYVRFIYLDALLIPLFLYDWFTLRHIHRVILIGAAILVMIQVTVTMSWGSVTWHQFWFNRSAPFVEKPVEITLTDVQSDLLVGDYGDKAWHLTISRDKRKLYLKVPNQPKWELGATADTALFVKTMIWNLSFTKGPDGQVKQLTNTQGPSVWKVSKLKQP